MNDNSVDTTHSPAKYDTPTSNTELDRMISEPNADVVASVATTPGDFLVLGAGGKMGLHLCQMLQTSLSRLGRANKVIAVSRFSSKDAATRFADLGIETVAADLSDPTAYSDLPASPNVFFLAGVKFGTASSPDLLNLMNVQTPRLVAQHYRGSRIIALSTGCVYSFTSPESGGSTEASPMEPPGDYAASCIGRENEFINASNQYKTPCTLVRLNYSVELRYGVLVDIAQKVFDGKPIHVDTGYANVIWQGDAISQIIRCLGIATSPPEVINITGCNIIKIRDIAHRFADIFGKPAHIQGHEAPTAWLSNNARSVELFGRPPTSIDKMIQRIAQWIISGGETLGKPTHFENRDGAY